MRDVRAFANESVLQFRAALNNAVESRWHNDPLAKGPSGSPDDFKKIHAKAQAKTFPAVDTIEQECGFAIDREWMESLALHTQVVRKKSDICYVHGRILYALLRKHIADSGESFITIVETGTARGFSALCMAKAIADSGVDGRIITLDIIPHLTPIYWNCIDDFEGRKTRAELLKPWNEWANKITFLHGDTLLMLPRVGVSRVNFAFLDAQHIRRSVIAEFNAVTALQQPGDMIFFDDVTPAAYPGVAKAVDEIEEEGHYALRRFEASNQRAYAWGTKLR